MKIQTLRLLSQILINLIVTYLKKTNKQTKTKTKTKQNKTKQKQTNKQKEKTKQKQKQKIANKQTDKNP